MPDQLTFYLVVFGIPALVAFALAVIPALAQRSWKRFFHGFVLSVVGLVLPMIFFLGDYMLQPDWKGACRLGWVDCFHAGKLALTPLVLWACLAFYSLEIWRVQNRNRPWIVLGFFLGTIISFICLLSGIFCLKWDDGGYSFLLVPFYTVVWYALRTAQLMRSSGLHFKKYIAALGVSLPFWVGSAIWSYYDYTLLPERLPECSLPMLLQHFATVTPVGGVANNSIIL